MKIVELFSGTGCQTQALKNIGIKHESYTCEWQIDSIISYDAIHTDDGIDYTKDLSKQDILSELSKLTFSSDGKNPCKLGRMKEDKLRLLYNANKRSNNLGDISKIEKLPECDLVFHSTPCQAFSVAGKGEGGDKDSGTSSSLMWESVRLIKDSKPKYVIWENVKNVLSKKHRHNFNAYLEEMSSIGYNNYYEVLNAKDFHTPQNRERIFCVSIRKDIDNGYEFPKKQELKIVLKDILEENVDEKYYLGKDKFKTILDTYNSNVNLTLDKTICEQRSDEGLRFFNDNICGTIRTKESGGDKRIIECKTPKILKIGMLDTKGGEQTRRVYSIDGISPTIDTMQGGNRQPKIVTHNFTQTVKIRKHDVDIEGLKQLLRNHKKISNKEIANRLNRPITLVEHWFRKDNCFSIPDEDIWFDLKELLDIKTDKFDTSITEFEYRDGIFDKSNRVYDENGIAPTLTGTNANEKILESKSCKILAQRGRYNGDGNIEQQFEIRKDELTNTITTVQKDNYLYNDYRIRKLTPRECWRLMGWKDEQFEKAEKVCSNSKLYQQAGNGIVINVLEEIFKNLFKK